VPMDDDERRGRRDARDADVGRRPAGRPPSPGPFPLGWHLPFPVADFGGVSFISLSFSSHLTICLPSFTRFNWVLLGFTVFYWVSLGFIRFYQISVSFYGFYWVLRGFNGLSSILLGFTGFHWI